MNDVMIWGYRSRLAGGVESLSFLLFILFANTFLVENSPSFCFIIQIVHDNPYGVRYEQSEEVNLCRGTFAASLASALYASLN